MSGEVLTREGRVVSGSPTGVGVEVVLRVGDRELGHRGFAAELELVLDDGSALTVVTDARTRTADLHERSETGPWQKLSRLPHAELVRDHAPGPHVRASLVERVVEPGTRVIVRGTVIAGDRGAPSKVRAVELRRSTAREQAVAAERTRARADLRDWVGRGFGALMIGASWAWAFEWLGRWPAALAHPGVDQLRLAVGVGASLSTALGLSLLLRRPGWRLRMLPRFVGGDGNVLGETGILAPALFIALIMTVFWGLLGAGFALRTIAAAGDLLVRGSKGRPIDSSGFTLNSTLAFAAASWLALLAWEWGSTRLAKLLRPLGPDWQVARGRLARGSLQLTSTTVGQGKGASTHWSGGVDRELVVEGPEGRWTIASEGLVWAVDLGAPGVGPEQRGRSTTWRTGPGAAVVLAGRLAGRSELRASGPESLILVASELDDDPLTSIRIGLWKRRVILAVPLLGALLSAAAVYL